MTAADFGVLLTADVFLVSAGFVTVLEGRGFDRLGPAWEVDFD